MKRYQKASNTSIVKKAIPLDTKIVIVNNSGVGMLFYKHERIELVIDLKEPTSYDELTLADLKIIRQNSKGVFTNYMILIADVLVGEFSLKDV